MTHFIEVSRSTLGLYYCGNSEHRHMLVTVLFESSVPLGTLHCCTGRKVNLEHFCDFFFFLKEFNVLFTSIIPRIQPNQSWPYSPSAYRTYLIYSFSDYHSSAECLVWRTEQKQAEFAPSRATFSRLKCHTYCPLPSRTSLTCLCSQNSRKDSCSSYTENFTFHRVTEL